MELFIQLIIGFLLFITYFSYKLFIEKEGDEYSNLMYKESQRCLNSNCKFDDKIESNGRPYKIGFIIEKKGNKKYFIKQTKLSEIGILS